VRVKATALRRLTNMCIIIVLILLIKSTNYDRRYAVIEVLVVALSQVIQVCHGRIAKRTVAYMSAQSVATSVLVYLQDSSGCNVDF